MVTRARRIVINYSWCKRCGICTDLCPKGVFEPGVDGSPVPRHGEACSGCGLCVLICPDYAVDWDTTEHGGSGSDTR